MTLRSPPAARHRRPFLLYLLAAAVPLLLYARTATFDFVHADDADLIAGNQAFLTDAGNVPRAFGRSYFEVEGELTAGKTYYRPVAIVSFMLDAAAAGADPRQYHATNVVLHAAATCLVLALAVAWGAPRAAALVAALVFAVHPVNAQAVAWIAGRNELLLAVSGLTSLLAFAALKGSGTAPHRVAPTPNRAARPSRTAARRAAQPSTNVAHASANNMPQPSANNVRQPSAGGVAPLFTAAIHVLAFAAALFSKETGVVFPLLAVLHQRLVVRRRPARLQWMALAGDAAVVAVWAALRARALEGMPSELTPATLHAALANAPQLLLHLRKMVLPVQLNVAPGVQDRDLLLGAAAAIAFALVFTRYVAGPLRTLAVAWVLLFLLPTLAVPAMPAYEHRAYLPLAGVTVCLAVAAARFTGRSPGSLARAAAPALIVTLGIVTSTRLAVFRDPFSYWTDAARDPVFGALAHVNLGQLHEGAGRLHDARREYLEALARDPNTPKAHNNLGVVLMALDEPDLAARHFEEETALHPWNADAWFNLGLSAERSGDAAAARRYYERAIGANPAYAPAQERLRELK